MIRTRIDLKQTSNGALCGKQRQLLLHSAPFDVFLTLSPKMTPIQFTNEFKKLSALRWYIEELQICGLGTDSIALTFHSH